MKDSGNYGMKEGGMERGGIAKIEKTADKHKNVTKVFKEAAMKQNLYWVGLKHEKTGEKAFSARSAVLFASIIAATDRISASTEASFHSA